MKRNIIILTLILVVLASCKKDFLSVNETNPNSPSSVPPGLMLTSALNTTVRYTNLNTNAATGARVGFDFVYLWYGQWSISQGYSQPTNLTQYNLFNNSYQGIWNNNYITAGNFDYIEKASQGSKSKKYLAMAKIMKAYIFHILVDCYGNIPYTDAFKATSGNLKPKYDDQRTIYEDLVTQLDAAIALIASSTGDDDNPGAYDVMYHGDMSKWAKFANSLKLRILIHQTAMSGRIDGYIKTALGSATTDQFIGAGDGALVSPGYSKSDGKQNPFWEVFYKGDGTRQADAATYYYAGQDMIDFLTNTADPRIGKFFAPYSGNSYGGNYFGAATLLVPTLCSAIGPGVLKSYNQPGVIMTDFESLFLQAEAAARGIISGDAKALYEEAVTQSFLYMGLTTADATNYLSQANANANYDLAADKIRLIVTQKWVSLNGITPYEIWTDYRRTGFPAFLHFTQDPNRRNITPPVRLLYPQTELNYNSDAVLAQGTIDAFSSKIFWQAN